jgi:hypothetical protein
VVVVGGGAGLVCISRKRCLLCASFLPIPALYMYVITKAQSLFLPSLPCLHIIRDVLSNEAVAQMVMNASHDPKVRQDGLWRVMD